MISYLRDHDVHVYKFYPGNELPESEIVTIDLTHAAHVVIDGFNISGADYQQVQILPGWHELLWGKDQGRTVVDLAAGHTYELRWDRAHGRGQKVYFWIQDAQSQEVISGTKKP
jgi:hypothetical protein